VDADQSYLGPQVLTSAEKKVDVAVFQAIRRTKSGTFAGGDLVFDARNGGVGIGKISSKVPSADVAKVRAQEKLLRAGKIAGIPEAPK
jgi:basic membrane protein A